MCKVFPTTFSGVALEWYRGLKPDSISSFEQLSEVFLTRFSLAVKSKSISTDLIDVRQMKGESLRSYLDRFYRAATAIGNLNMEVAVDALARGTRFEPLKNELYICSPKTFVELMA